jgi:hypothetical protein
MNPGIRFRLSRLVWGGLFLAAAQGLNAAE